MICLEPSDTSSSLVTMTSLMGKKKAIASYKVILKYPTKEQDITHEEDVEDEEDKLNIYEGKSKAWDFLIISLTGIPFGLVMQCDENGHEFCKALIDKYGVSDEKLESLDEVKNRQ